MIDTKDASKPKDPEWRQVRGGGSRLATPHIAANGGEEYNSGPRAHSRVQYRTQNRRNEEHFLPKLLPKSCTPSSN